MKKYLSILLVLVLCLSVFFAGCAGNNSEDALSNNDSSVEVNNATEPAEKRLAYFICIKSGGVAWSKTQRGFEDICEELGWEGHFVAPQQPADFVEMAQLLDMAINEGADFIGGIWGSEEMFGDALNRAREQGAIVCNIQASIGDEGEYVDFEMGTDHYNMGVMQGELLKKLADPEKEYNVLYLVGSASEVLNLRYSGFLTTLEDCANIKHYGMEFENENAVTAADVISNTLKANPDINCIICNDSTGATMGSASYIEENGLADDILVIGMDDSADILNYLKNGTLDATIATGNYAMGYDSVRIANEMLTNGYQPSMKNDTGTIAIYPEEVDAYAAENGIDLG